MTETINIYSTCWKSGAGWFVHAMAQSIAEAGLDVKLLAPTAEPIEREATHPRLTRVLLSRGGDGANCKIVRFGLTLAKVAQSLVKLAALRFYSPNYLATFIGQLPAGLAHFLLVRAIGGRLVYVVHDVTPHAWSLPLRLRRLERAMLRLSYRLPTQLVTLTDAARDELVTGYGIAGKRVSVIPHGAFIPPSVTPSEDNGMILLFGMLRRNKRIQEAITAFRLHPHRFPGMRLVIAGEPHRDDRAYWETCAAQIVGSEDRITTEIGFIAETRLTELINSADGVLLSYEEFNSQSGAAVLACFSERPIIGTCVGGLEELRSMGLELIEVERPVTADSIAGALERFAQLSLTERQGMARRSRGALERHLGWSAIGYQYRRLIAGL